MTQIKIIDMPMGAGKTNGMITYMNAHPERKYLFITPYLGECERIQRDCPRLHFRLPSGNYISKSVHLEKLISEGENIAATHSLFSLMSRKARNNLKQQDYVLVLDEELNTIWKPNEVARDIEMITDELIRVDEATGLIRWDWQEGNYSGRFAHLRNYVRTQKIYVFNNALVGEMDTELFTECFSEIVILTYLFKFSVTKCYFDIYNINYDYYHFEDSELISGLYDDSEFRENSRELIKICDHTRINEIGVENNALSKSWFDKRDLKDEHKILKNNLKNYFTNLTSSTKDTRLWSTFSKYKDYYSGNGYKTAFISCNLKASNEYRNCEHLAYLMNAYANPILKQWFHKKGITYSDDSYALSMLIQWMWRSTIRDGNSVELYLPSKRMQDLLCRWQAGDI